MKKTLLLLLVFAPAIVFAQMATQKAIALSPGFDAGQVILPTQGGGYAIFGRESAAPGAKTDVFFLRVDAQGNQLAYKKYGDANTSESVGKGVVALQNGWLLAGSKTVISPTGWLVRTNASGDVLWSKDVPGTSRINQIVPLPSGGLLATGQSLTGRMLLLELTDDGTIKWQQNYTPGEGRDLYVTTGGNACIVLGSKQIWKVHLASRQIQWEQEIVPPPFGPTNRTEFFALTGIVPMEKGQFAIIGSAYTDLITELHSGHFAAVWNETGTPVWQKYLHETTNSSYDQNEGYSIFYLPNSKNILFAGSEDGHAAVTRTDQNGKIVEDVDIIAPGTIFGLALIKDAGYYVMTGAVMTGSINTYFYRSASNDLAKSAAPASEFDRGTRATDFLLQHEPDAARLTVQITTEVEREGIFQLWDLNGRMVWEKKARLTAGNNRLELETGKLNTGIYWLRELGSDAPAKAFVVGG